MTKIIITYKNKEIKSILISGHANSDDYGKDIVCASISLVIFGSLNALEGIKKSDVKINKVKAYINISIPHKLNKEDKIRLDMMITQLNTIANKYKKYVVIKKERK